MVKLIAALLILVIRCLLYGLGIMIGTYVLNKYFPAVPAFNYGNSFLLGIALALIMPARVDFD